MRLAYTRALFFAFFLMVFGLLPASSQAIEKDHTTPSMVLSKDQVKTGGSFDVLFHLDIEPGWHTYWINPGDFGTAPRIEWKLPEGWSAGEIEWLPPSRIATGHLVNYGYSKQADHLIRVNVSASAVAGESEFQASAKWLVCKEECIPQRASFTLKVTVGNEDVASPQAKRIVALRQQIDGVKEATITAVRGEKSIDVSLPYEALRSMTVQDAYFFSDVRSVVDHAGEQRFEMKGDGLVVYAPRGTVAPTAKLGGYVRITEIKGSYYLGVQEEGGGMAAVSSGVALILLLAFAGGMLLNLMPCVFPVLSLKALSLVSHHHEGLKHARASGLAYTAGVVLSFAVVGAALLALRAGGEAVGWGFQMQSPPVVGVLAYVMFIVALVLTGIMPLRLSISVNASPEKESLTSSFLTGILATVVATPCTAPFMATALGAALVQPAPVAMLIFVALGLGLAVPYLLLAWVPAVARLLPKPGAWMEVFRQFLAFPMLLAAVWLVWVYSEQVGAFGTALLLAGFVGLTFVAWLGRVLPKRCIYCRWFWLIVITALSFSPLLMAKHEASSDADAFSVEKVEALRAEGRAVFVNATAAWCITCHLNERVAIQSVRVQELFASENVAYLVADWTNEDENIADYLRSFGRSGVPLYVFYPAGGAEPVVLPQLLTPEIVASVIQPTKP